MENITLSELINQSYPNVPFIGIYTDDGPIYPDYTDEILETHGDLIVVDSYYSKRNDVLVVSFDKKIN